MISSAEWAVYPTSDQDLMVNIEVLAELCAYDSIGIWSDYVSLTEEGALVPRCELTPFHWSRQVECPWALRKLELAPDHRCLDVGASGPFSFAVARRCKELVSIDPDTNLISKLVGVLDKGRKHFRDGSLDGMWYARCKAEQLPFPDNHFDRVFCISVLEHIEGVENRWQALKECVRVLKWGGRFILTMDVVASESAGKGNFYVLPQDAANICQGMGIEVPKAPVNIIHRTFSQEDVTVAVMMICYIKQ